MGQLGSEYSASVGGVDGPTDHDLSIIGLYGVFRTVGGRIFAKGKIGGFYGWTRDNVKYGEIEYSFGGGMGARIASDASLELEYTKLVGEIYFLSIGFGIWF